MFTVNCESGELKWPNGEPTLLQYYTRDASGFLKIRKDVISALLECQGVSSMCPGCGVIIVDLQPDLNSNDHDTVWSQIHTALTKLGYNVLRDDFKLENYVPTTSYFDSTTT